MKYLILLIFLQVPIKAFLKDCEPQNVHVSLQEDYFQNDNPNIKIIFTSKVACSTLTVVKIEYEKEVFTYEFNLADIYLAKIYDDIEGNYYKRYIYISEPLIFDHKGKFDYKIMTNYDVEPELLRKFTYQSNITLLKKGKNLKILTYGDQPLNDLTDKFIENIVHQDYDLIILLGDLANFIHDNYGEKGDDYFNALEPLITKIPVLLTPGNNDLVDSSRLLNSRFRFGTNILKQENNYYNINLPDVSFIFFNFDNYYFLDQEGKELRKRWLYDKMDELILKFNPKFRIFVSHRPFRCLNKDFKEACHEDIAEKYSDIEVIVSQYNFNIHLSSHINLYQRFNNKLFQTEFHTLEKYWDNKEFNPINIITGTGGMKEFETEFDGEYNNDKDLPIKIIPNIVGFTVLELNYPLEKIKGNFISFGELESNSLDEYFIYPYIEKKQIIV